MLVGWLVGARVMFVIRPANIGWMERMGELKSIVVPRKANCLAILYRIVRGDWIEFCFDTDSRLWNELHARYNTDLFTVSLPYSYGKAMVSVKGAEISPDNLVVRFSESVDGFPLPLGHSENPKLQAPQKPDAEAFLKYR